jgi:hypothetical protein
MLTGIPDDVMAGADELLRRLVPRLGVPGATPPIVAGNPVQARLGSNPVAQATGQERLGQNPNAPDLEQRIQTWEGQQPTMGQAPKISLGRRIAAGVGGALAGWDNPRLGVGTAENIVSGPRRQMEADYANREKAWEQQGKGLETEANVARLGQREPLHVAPGTMVEQPGGGFEEVGTPKEKPSAPKSVAPGSYVQQPDGTWKQIGEKPAPSDIGKMPPEIEAQIGPAPTTASFGGKTYPSVEAARAAWGKQAEALKNAEAGAAGESRFMPLLESRTQNLIDPDTGLPTVFQWDPKTKSYTKQVGVSATGAYGHEMAQAGAVTRAGDQLITDIQANKQRLGTLAAWVKKYGLNTPIADPELARLQSELSTFSALQPAMHGFRSKSAMETFDKVIGGLQKNPDATIQSIQGILQTAGQINPALQNRGGAPQAYKVGDTITQNGHSYTVRAVDKNGKVTKAD